MRLSSEFRLRCILFILIILKVSRVYAFGNREEKKQKQKASRVYALILAKENYTENYVWTPQDSIDTGREIEIEER